MGLKGQLAVDGSIILGANMVHASEQIPDGIIKHSIEAIIAVAALIRAITAWRDSRRKRKQNEN